MNKYLVGSALGTIQQGLLKVPVSLSCNSYRVSNFFDTCFVDVLARWLFSRESFGANSAIMNVVCLWRARASANRGDVFVCNHRYKHVAEAHPCRMLKMNLRTNCQPLRSWNIRYKKEPAVHSSNPCLSPLFFKCIFFPFIFIFSMHICCYVLRDFGVANSGTTIVYDHLRTKVSFNRRIKKLLVNSSQDAVD